MEKYLATLFNELKRYIYRMESEMRARLESKKYSQSLISQRSKRFEVPW